MKIWPVIRENIMTGALGLHVHALDVAAKATLCGQTIYIEDGRVQFSVEPEGTPITCPRCLALHPQPNTI